MLVSNKIKLIYKRNHAKEIEQKQTRDFKPATAGRDL